MATSNRLQKITQVASQRQNGLTVVLEDISDPHNAQAVLRSCDAFGVQEVHFIFENEPVYDPKKIGKVSSSSANKWLDFHIHSSTVDCFSQLRSQGFACVATVLDPAADSLYEAVLSQKNIAVFFGNEHRGLSPEAIRSSDLRITLPMKGMVQSLNLSVAAAIYLFEITRQRMSGGLLTTLSPQSQTQLIQNLSKR